MPRYILRRDAKGKAHFIEVERDYSAPRLTPYIQSDLPDYKSPLGTGTISGRAARREEMKRHHVREVDPSEYKPMNPEQLREMKKAAEKDPRHVKNRKATTVDISNTALERSIAKKEKIDA